MLINRVKLDQKAESSNFGDIKATVNENEFCVELCSIQPRAQAYNVINGEEIPFKNYKRYCFQEYEAPEFSREETKQYKDALYSKKGLRLLNRLKNTSLIKANQAKEFFTLVGLPEKLTKKILSYLYPQGVRRRLDFRVEEDSFNRISLKDLNITKSQVMQLFINEGLIYET